MQKSLASILDLVISLMKQVEYQEKAAAQAIEEVAMSGLDILVEVEQLKQKHRLAKETIDKHARKVYKRKAALASEMTELQSRASSVLNEGCTSLAVLNK
nr:hypothetical protein [Tanacetum cinerariifolium]